MNISNPQWSLQLISSKGEVVGDLKVKRNRCNPLIKQLWDRYLHVEKIKIVKLNNTTKLVTRP